MENKNLHCCPYCGERVPYHKMLINEKNGEYTCENCGRYSNIKMINKSLAWTLIFVFASVAAILGIFTFKETLKGVMFSIIPFIIMYLIIPLFLRLVPITLKKKTSVSKDANTIYSNSNPKTKQSTNNFNNKTNNQGYNSDDDVKMYIRKKEKG